MITDTFAIFKFRCNKGAKPNLLEFIVLYEDGTPDNSLTVGSAVMVDPSDALACSELVPGPITGGTPDGSTALNCELGFFYIVVNGLVAATDAGMRFTYKLEDDETYTMAD